MELFFRKFHVTPSEGRGEKRLEENLNYFPAEKKIHPRVQEVSNRARPIAERERERER